MTFRKDRLDLDDNTSDRSTTGRPIDDDAPADPMELLSRIAGKAMEAGADPSAVVSPDHELLTLCDSLILLGRHCDRVEAIWRDCPGTERERHAQASAEHDRAQRALRGPLLRVGKLRAVTPAGIFAKALVVQKVGTIAATALSRSLANDLLGCAELREAIWPAAAQRRVPMPGTGFAAHDEMTRDELRRLIVRALAFDPAEEGVPDSPDTEFIGLCRRLAIIHRATEVALKAIPDDERERDDMLAPLNDVWFEIAARVRQLQVPRTLEGARAAAVVLAEYPGVDDMRDALAFWLAWNCVAYFVPGMQEQAGKKH